MSNSLIIESLKGSDKPLSWISPGEATVRIEILQELVIEANDQISLYQIPSHEGGILNSKTFLFADEGAVIYLSTAINPGEPKEDMINIRIFDVRQNAPELIVDIQTHRISFLNKEDVYTTSDFTSQQLDMLKTLITEAKPITVDRVNKFFASHPAS